MHGRLLSSIPGVQSLDANSISLVVTIQHVSSLGQMPPGGQNCP